MKINKANWATCPHCGILLNGYQFYPLGIVMSGSSQVYVEHKCDNCDKKFDLACKITIEFEALASVKEEPLKS